MMIKSSIILFFTCFAFTKVNGQGVNFTDCGGGNVREVRVRPCSGDPCIINLGSTVEVEADFEAPINANSLSEVIKGVVRGRELPFPETRKDPCSGYIVPSCPIKKGRKYLFKASFEVKPFYPAIPIKVKYSLTDKSGRMVMCVQLNAKIHDPNPNPKSSKNQRRNRSKTKKPAISESN